MPCSAPPPALSPPSATVTSRRSPAKGGWLGSVTAATIKGPVSRASSRAGSRSSVTGCASTATRPAPPRLLSPPRRSTECSTLDARTPSASPDQQWGMGPPLPLPPPCNTLTQIPAVSAWRVLSKQWQGEFCRCSIDVVGGKQCDGGVDHLERFRHNTGPSAKAGKPMTQPTVDPLDRHRFILADIVPPNRQEGVVRRIIVCTV